MSGRPDTELVVLRTRWLFWGPGSLFDRYWFLALRTAYVRALMPLVALLVVSRSASCSSSAVRESG